MTKRTLRNGITLCLITVFLTGSIWAGEISNKLQQGRGRYRLQSAEIELQGLPQSVDEFLKLRKQIATTPQGGYALFVIAMLTYEKNPELAKKFFVIAVDRSKLRRSGSGWYRGYKVGSSLTYHLRRLKRQPWLPKVYFAGTKQSNGYALPSPPVKIRFRQLTVYRDNDVSLYAFTTSGNRARPIRLKKNNRGYWKAYSFSSLFVGVSRPPQQNSGSDDDI